MSRAGWLSLIAIQCILCACARTPETYPAPDISEKAIQIYIACLAAPTSYHDAAGTVESPTPPASTAASTPTRFLPFILRTVVENVNLRTNPGYLFAVIRVLSQGIPIRITGRSPGGEWFYGSSSDGSEGWVFGVLLEPGERLKEVPTLVPHDVLTLNGRVLDGQAHPIQGVVFSVSMGSGQDAPANIVVSDSLGMFYSFLPPDSCGTWTVAYTAIACLSNVWMPGGCESYKPEYRGLVEPPSVDINLSHEEPLMFTWK